VRPAISAGRTCPCAAQGLATRLGCEKPQERLPRILRNGAGSSAAWAEASSLRMCCDSGRSKLVYRKTLARATWLRRCKETSSSSSQHRVGARRRVVPWSLTLRPAATPRAQDPEMRLPSALPRHQLALRNTRCSAPGESICKAKVCWLQFVPRCGRRGEEACGW
jgi:hypothetical protein